jgi:hypothetical protein
MNPVMRVKQYISKGQSIAKTVPMDSKNMHGTPEKCSAEQKIAHRNKSMLCNK